MSTVWQNAIDLEVYDEEGNFVERLNIIQKDTLVYTETVGVSYLSIVNATNSIKMLELLAKDSPNKRSDFEKATDSTNEKKVLTFNQREKRRKLKLIANSVSYNLETGDVEHDVRIAMPNVEMVRDYEINAEVGEVYTPEYVFAILPYNEDEDAFQIELIKRKRSE